MMMQPPSIRPSLIVDGVPIRCKIWILSKRELYYETTGGDKRSFIVSNIQTETHPHTRRQRIIVETEGGSVSVGEVLL